MRKVLLFSLLICFSCAIWAQPSIRKMKANLNIQDTTTTAPKMFVTNENQASILFSKEKGLPGNQPADWLTSQLALRKGVDILSRDGLTNTGSVTVEKLHQYYKGIKVEHGVINSTAINGKVSMMQMEYYSINDTFRTTAVLSEKAALQKAIDFTGAQVYAWTGYTGTDSEYMKPHGELVIVSTYKQPGEVCLAYKFNVYALQPVSRALVYVNAWDGTVVLNDPIIKHVGNNRFKTTANAGDKYVQESNHGTNSPVEENYETIAAADVKTAFNFNEDKNILTNKASNSIANNNSIASNSLGTADTRFLGQQNIVTDNNSGVQGLPYRLRESRNGQNIITLNYHNRAYNTAANNDAIADDYIDDDNSWTAAEFHNDVSFDDAALDVHFNMQIISDYWLNVHQRNGWDNNNGELRSYVDVEEARFDNNNVFIDNYFFPNAFWGGKNMHFGNGNGTLTNSQPYTTLDISAHEMGHAITQTTSSLVYQWESGAMNEAFSDIWAACVTNYAKVHYASMPDEVTWRIAEKCANLDKTNTGFRDMSNPGLFSHPSTYQNIYWKPASLQTCRVFTTANDNCGVHTNSGVLNKWFFLITDGENSYNSFGRFYNVTGLGFGESQKIAYLTSINLTPNATYATAKTVSINAATILYGSGSAEVKTVTDAWVAVGVDSNIYNMSNTSVFTTSNFTAIAVDGNGDVWAGTNYNGLYRYTNSKWEKRNEVPNVRINDIKTDKDGNIWIAQSGTQAGGSQALAGGVNYLKSPFGATDNYFYTIGAQSNIPSRNARNIFIDTSRTSDGLNPRVWVATQAYITSGNSTSGMLGQGLYSSSKYFHNVSGGLNIASGTAGISTVGGNSLEIWGFAQANNGVNQLLTYDAGTNNFIAAYDHNSVPAIPSGFVARSIFGDRKKRIWVPLANNGLLVVDEYSTVHYINFPAAFPAGTQASPNAICGDRFGNVYIGTNNGIVFFDRGDGLADKIDNPKNYRLFSQANGLPSNQINALAYDTSRFNLMVATDSGVVFFEPLCLSPYCKEFTTNADITSASTGSGNWSDPTIWSDNKVPDSLTMVTITNNVAVDINAKCKTLTVLFPGSLTVQSSMSLTLYPESVPIIIGSEKVYNSSKMKK